MRRLATATLFLGMITLPYALPAQEVDAPVRYDEDYLSADFHRGRRAAVVAQLPGNSLVVLFGAPMRNRSNDMDYEYRQASDFLYLTGSEEPGSALILAPGGLEVDGERVSWMRTFEVAHRLREVEITSLGVVGVHTADEYQNRGHMRFMLESVLERSRERGILLSTLYGVPSLYQRWAYASVMPEFVITISTRQAESVRRNHRVRSADRSD